MKIWKFLMVVILALFFAGCYEGGQQVQADNSVGNFSTTYLFTVESVKVYRFWDGGAAHYLAVGDGQMLNSKVGKSKNSAGHDDSAIGVQE